MGWTHDVAFSPSGNNLAWVSHNSIIFAVSSNDPSKYVNKKKKAFFHFQINIL